MSRGLRALRVALGLLATALLLQACAHVPLGTMWRMRDFGPNTLLQADPVALRAAVQVPDALGLQPTGHTLVIHIDVDGGQPPPLDVAAMLEVELSLRESGPLESRPGSHWHVLKLDASGAAEFAKFRDFMEHKPEGKKGSFELAVKPNFGGNSGEVWHKMMCSEDNGELSVALRIAPDQDWLVLVQDHPLSFTTKQIEAARAEIMAKGEPDPLAGIDCGKRP